MATQIGEIPWKVVYSLVSLAGLVLILWGIDLTRTDSIDLYTPPVWLQHVSLVMLLPVFPLLAAAYLPGRIKVATRHPMLLATKIWAFAHLLSNGSLVDVILFGSLLVWASLDRVSMKHRQQRPIPGAPTAPYNDVIALVLGIGIYLAFVIWLHELLIGVPPV